MNRPDWNRSTARGLSAVARGLAILTFAGVTATLVAGGEGAAGSKKGVPSPKQQLKDALLNLQKARGYAVSLGVQGGISNNPEHAVTTFTVKEDYGGSVHQNLMHVDTMKSYRYRAPKKGVRYIDGAWKQVSADRAGQIMDRLFSFPEEVLTNALKYAAAGQWVDPAASADAKASETSGEGSGSTPSTAPARGGKTAVSPDSEKKSAAEALVAIPRVMRIEVPAKEALNHYLTVEKSGCVGGG